MKVKICGITSINDALKACESGADALGFVFYKKSPRYIAPGEAAKIIEKLPAFVSTAGVFVDDKIEDIIAVMRSTGIDYAQLHGNEPISTVCKFGRRAIKAFRINDNNSIEQVNNSGLGIVLLDSYTDAYGGSGMSFDHRLLKSLLRNIKVILSGGITPDNVRGILDVYTPYAIDVSSGVETAPGKKSKEKIKTLFKNIERYKEK